MVACLQLLFRVWLGGKAPSGRGGGVAREKKTRGKWMKLVLEWITRIIAEPRP